MPFLTRWSDDQSQPGGKEAARDLATRVVAPMTAWWLLVMGIGWLITDGPFNEVDKSEDGLIKDLAQERTSTLDNITHVFSWAGATASIIGLCVVVAGIIWWRTRRWWFAVVPLIAISMQALVFYFTTLLIDRERPPVEKLDNSPPTSSYPSGHTGAATGLYFTFALMALRIKQPVLRVVVVLVCLAMPFLVATARLYRGMHHPSDVIVSIVTGALAALLAWAWLRRDPHRTDGADRGGREAQSRA